MKRAFSFLTVLVVIAVIVLLKQDNIISEALASALIGAIIPLAGVLWTIEYGYRQFREGLREDRRKIVDDRAYNAKQAAFMAATDAAAKFVDYLITLPDSEPVASKVAPEAEELNIALNKLHYYCGLDTIKKCIEVAEAFSVGAGEISKAKLESLFLAIDMKGIDVRLGGLQTMIDRLNAQIQTAFQANPQDQQIAFWRGQLANFYGQSGELYRQKGELDVAKYRATEKCRDVMLAQLKGMCGLSVDLLILARRELEFKIPENEYQQLMRAQAQTSFAKMDELMGEVRAQVNKKLAAQTQAKV
jgi:hypothetical protein